ncbi:hypothetical protein K491DRAFT_692304 [Lophiostoma macrostomum CBS 122681]|uniref:Uncharacterized protein n=1 Tax=Lophiostoma macrostomum CBS 122681 TaxID=1314788 RepID=A0A6A6T8E6_9PLEO|nr:hypothetical protein K491DRAFT_692304 [Lophiostoma macrostomum CBS 122681]
MNLPRSLEGCLQNWLTPGGWRVGPPRIVTWGFGEAYFAISEYGEVKYETGLERSWIIFEETVEEWEAEAKFEWSNLAYISLDPTTPDQFVAIRQDRTWAGSIDDNSEDALEAFALHYFSRRKSKSRAKGKDQRQTNGPPKPTETKPDAASQALYEKWSTEVAMSFASALAAIAGKANAPRKLQIRSHSSQASIPTSLGGKKRGKLLSEFPYLPEAITICRLETCRFLKAEAKGLRACKHDVDRLFRASGLYSYEWLRQERLRWHPDRFGRLCEEDFREEGRKLAEEMFKMIDILMSELVVAQ